MGEELRRIAFFTNTFTPDINGVSLVISTFRRELQRRGVEVYVFAPAPVGDDPLKDDPHILRFPSVRLLSMDYAAAVPFSRHVSRTLRRVAFDLVHTHHPLWVGQWGAHYARRSKIPHVTTIHTHYELFASLVPLPQSLVKMYLRRRVRRHCNSCQVVTTPAPSNKSQLEQMGLQPLILVVPNPVDVTVFEQACGETVRKRLGLGGKFVLGYVGRLSPEKQLPLVVQAGAKVCAECPAAHLLIVGDGPSRPEVEEQVRGLGLADRCTLVGSVPHDQVPDYQAALDVFLTASLAETQPLAYAEAMAAGTPVVAVTGLGAVDMIEDGVNGFLVSRQDAPKNLAQAVLRLAKDRSLHDRLSRQAREWARRYSVSEATDRLFEAYKMTLDRFALHPAGTTPVRLLGRTPGMAKRGPAR
ncbi:MAG: glycosyltransferase [Armatimonadota bacterium]